MSQTVRVRYSAGGWLGLVRGRCLVALPADASEETAAVAWDLLAGTPGVERLLSTVLTGRLDLTGLPSFAIVSFREGASVHAILRGEVSLRLTTTDGGTAELNGTGVATWNERVFRDIDTFELLLDDAAPDVENLPLESGAVRLGSLHTDLGTMDADQGAAPAAEPVPEQDAAAEGPADEAPAAEDPAFEEAVTESDAPDAAVEDEHSEPGAPDADAPIDEAEPVQDAEVGGASDDAAPDVAETDDDAWDDNTPDDAAQEETAEGETVQDTAQDRPEEMAEDSAGDDVTDQEATIAPGVRPDPSASATDGSPTDENSGAGATGAAEDALGSEDADEQTIAGPVPGPPSSPPAGPPDSTVASGSATGGPSARPGGSVPGPQELIDSVPWLAAARKAVPPQAPEAPAPRDTADEADEQVIEVPADLNMTVAPGPSFDDEAEPTGSTPKAADALSTNAEDADDADTVLSPVTPGTAPVPLPPAPPAGPPSGPASAGSPVFPAEDHDGETVMKSDLDPADLPASVPEPAPAPPPATGPVVLARQCSNNHANPPTSATCGICGQSLSGEAQQVRRPSLGRIRMSTGEVVELDRPAVVGRQPQAHRVGSGTMPRMVQVRSPNGDISRSHCEVVLEGWHVQLRDLKATNGTVLIREGQPPRRLGQAESIMVLDGDIADLGDGVSLRFEGLL